MSTSFAIEIPLGLIDQARAGDLRALERIYRLFERPAYTLSLRLLADAEQARDSLHDAFMSAFARLDQFRGDAPFWGWLRQVVANTALMRLRRNRRIGSIESDNADHDESFADPVANPIRAAEAAELERMLAALPDMTRSVLWLHCVEGYSHVEIAELMGQSVSFSKSQVSRGLSRLRSLLKIEEVAHA